MSPTFVGFFVCGMMSRFLKSLNLYLQDLIKMHTPKLSAGNV